MGLAVYQPRTYFMHQKTFLFPLIVTYWKKYRKKFICQLQNASQIVWSEDVRFDSMGHSAKYGVYSMFNCNFNKILHFELIQVCVDKMRNYLFSQCSYNTDSLIKNRKVICMTKTFYVAIKFELFHTPNKVHFKYATVE